MLKTEKYLSLKNFGVFMKNTTEKIAVWDPFVRIHHWLLASSFLLAWASAEELEGLHAQLGYFILVLISLRITWGLVGSRYSRFINFVYSPRNTLDYLQSLAAGRPPRHTGHNPAGGWMVIMLIVGLIASATTGIMVEPESLWEELHEGIASLTMTLVIVHIGGVMVTSMLQGENLVKAMLTGNKNRRDGNV